MVLLSCLFVAAILWGIGGFDRLGRNGEGRSELFP